MTPPDHPFMLEMEEILQRVIGHLHARAVRKTAGFFRIKFMFILAENNLSRLLPTLIHNINEDTTRHCRLMQTQCQRLCREGSRTFAGLCRNVTQHTRRPFNALC